MDQGNRVAFGVDNQQRGGSQMGKNNGTPLAEMIDYPTNPCLLCGKSSIVPLEPTKFFAWRKGELIQEVWPEKNDSERELLITGTHPECWTKIMGEEVE